MSNPKVFEYAKEIGMTPLALMDKIKEWSLPVKSHMSELEPEVLEQLKSKLAGGDDAADAKPKKTAVKKAATKTAASKAAPAAKTSATKTASAKTAAPKTAPKTAAAKAPVKVAKKSTESTVVAAAPAAAAKSTVVRRKKEDMEVVEAPQKAKTIEVEPEVEAPVQASRPQEVERTEAPAEKLTQSQAAAPTQTSAPASAPAPTATTVATAAAPAASAVAPTTSMGATAPGVAGPARKREVVMSGPGAAPQKRNIIGRMDLSRMQTPQGQGQGQGQRYQGGGAGGAGGATAPRSPGFGGPARTGPRNIRPGFVSVGPAAPAEPIPPGGFDNDRKKGGIDRRSKKVETTATATTAKEKEGETEQFNAVEFRKREMVFQPKKKKEFLNREAMQTQITKPKASKRILKVNGTMKVSDAAQEMGLKSAQLIKVLISNGVMANMNTSLDFDTLALIAPEFGWEAQNIFKTAEEMLVDQTFGDLDAERIERPPVVTVMGHVDHGKTSLLDAIRKAKVAAGEAGGITQHIGAYSVTLDNGKVVTFLDTPGHEAFTAMRARGANATDIAIIVVAADDGMMPQTAEAVNHAKAAGVPIIVAINKMDKPGANPEKIKQQLTELELVPEEWGGTTMYVPVSAVKKTGIDELLAQILLVAEVAELKANPKRSGTGIVIEAKMEKGKGPVATILVKDGTVRVGQNIVAGTQRGRIKSLMNDKGVRVNEIGPGYPVEVQGLDDTPMAGDQFDIVENEAKAEEVSSHRKRIAQDAARSTQGKMSLEDIFSKVTKGDVKELAIILKTDVQGSAEAIKGMLGKASAQEVKTRIIHSAVGGVTESDVLLAQTSGAIIIGFGVRPDAQAAAKSKQLGVEIRTYTIVYEMIDDIKKAMQGLLTPDVVEKVVGQVEVRNIFTVPKIGTIAGCFITEGKVQRSNMIRLVREGKIVYEGKISSLKRFKDDAREVASGFECGISIENFNDIKVGDRMEAYIKEEVARELTPMAPTPAP